MRPDGPLATGNAIGGFVWLGSYCGGTPASALAIPLQRSDSAPLRGPLHGPEPACAQGSEQSVLVDGVAGCPGEPVQPPRPEYTDLRLTGYIEPGSTSRRLAPIALTIRTT